MRHIAKPARFQAPGSDVLIPGRVADERGFIDTQVELDGLRGPLNIILSAEGIRIAAKKFPQLGLTDADEANALILALKDQVLAAEAERDAALARAEEAEADLAKINGLAARGFAVSKKKGPQAKKEVE